MPLNREQIVAELDELLGMPNGEVVRLTTAQADRVRKLQAMLKKINGTCL